MVKVSYLKYWSGKCCRHYHCKKKKATIESHINKVSYDLVVALSTTMYTAKKIIAWKEPHQSVHHSSS